ncbi:MAG TPA: FHA domain-containing protein [Archangium sp.]|uniref:FHA domain-containing protein n=1 Tax=Archangium sp. TaxID=1872627 RepID=UPI002E2F1783|nr:FHA domain-containing protein [Archangium sp.]HEX5752971.1 FHA domain-containing protein [Archangium sp.]
MALIEHLASHRRHLLEPRCLVGRSRTSSLRLTDSRVSGEHASLYWDGDSWLVRDLGSRNGTFLENQHLQPGLPLPLKPAALLAFGNQEDPWRLVEDTPPVASASQPDTNVRQLAEDGLLLLPGAEQPELRVYVGAEHGWVAESARGLTPVEDGQLVEAGGLRWRLHLPLVLERTADLHPPPLLLRHAFVRFTVSRDEEHVELTLSCNGADHSLSARAHNYALLLLARLRVDEASRLPPQEAGWIYPRALQAMLAVDRLLLNTQLSRARRLIASLGFQDAARLIERRCSTGQLRFGLPPERLSFRSAGGT